jgi:hypothetical protein
MSDKRNSYRILEGTQEGKRSLGRLRERRSKLDFSVSGYREVAVFCERYNLPSVSVKLEGFSERLINY